MAITTIDGLVAALASGQQMIWQKPSISTASGFWYSLWDQAGVPGAGSYAIGNTTNGVVPTDATAGATAITSFGGATGYLGMLDVIGAQIGQLRIHDRLWHAGTFSLGTLQTFTLSSQPSISGRVPNADYTCVEAWLEVVTANGATNTTIQITYTNQAGTTGRTASLEANINAAPIRRMLPFRLQAGDTGIQKVESVIVGGATGTGTVNVVLLRGLSSMKVLTAALGEPRQDAFKTGMPIVFDDSCISGMWFANASSSGVVFSELRIIDG
jgi:hypothetical protein